MLEGIEGIVIEQRDSSLVIGVGGFRFRVYCTPSSIERSGLGSVVFMHTYLHFSQDRAPELYGFSSEDEFSLFSSLLKVSKIGPKMALKILSSAPVQRLRSLIADRNVAELSRIPGMGKKTAERLVAEISDLVEAGTENASPENFDECEEAVRALISLGFEASSARQMVRAIAREKKDLSTQELIREALKSSKGETK
ncbi:MAG: Holliday junction ATP-dependent DNA helicase RuvA [Thermotogales bacterium 46_20]|nr:MAG: Holliday junction ATP-dependent DNA helicase RuvA [Thermotogales bacterium 46_20]